MSVRKLDTSQATRRRTPKYSYHIQSRENFRYHHIGLPHNASQAREDSLTLKENDPLFAGREDKRRKIRLTPLPSS